MNIRMPRCRGFWVRAIFGAALFALGMSQKADDPSEPTGPTAMVLSLHHK